MTDKAFDYIDQNRDRFLTELSDFLRFPSVSAQAAHKQDMHDCAGWLKDHLAALGLQAQLIETTGHPIVHASAQGQSHKRLIIYGHYDVQPEDPLELWTWPPFEPTVRDGFLYARGVSDDKGQLFAHVKAVETLLATQGQLPCDVLFLIEGEEESGGHALAQYVTNNKTALNCNAVLVSDCAMYDENTPAVTYGLRGCVALELTIKGPSRDIHSGSFGGAVANPIVVLTQILSRCIDHDGRVTIPGFYDNVSETTPQEKQTINQLAFDEAQLCQNLNTKRTFGEKGYSLLERIWARPTFEVNGIIGGYTGQGGKTIIPAQASCKITMRLVPHQDPHRIIQLVTDHLQNICPDTVEMYIATSEFAAQPVLFDTNHPALAAARQALQVGFGHDAIFIREGGSIPVVETFAQELQKPVILMGFGLHTDGAHSPNERFKIENFFNGIRTSTFFLKNFDQ